jgi:hypothetical protein
MMPSSGNTPASVRRAVEGLIGSVTSTASGAGRAAGAPRGERERGVGDDRVAHRRARGLIGVARDRHQPRALGEQRAGHVGVVREHRGADDQYQVVLGQGFADGTHGGGQDALEEGVILREAEPPATGGRGGVNRQALALGQADRVVPAAA